jgi:predicted ATP-dependent endonuclease of OLD family
MIKSLKVQNFTAFDSLDITFSPGINIFIGENGTGKTHILKAIYAACDISKSKKNFAEKINDVFYPSDKQIGRLVKRAKTSSSGSLEISRELPDGKTTSIKLSLTSHMLSSDKAKVTGARQWIENSFESVFIPVKDMMANAPAFRSLYATRNIHFEEVYADIIDRAFLPALKGPPEKQRSKLLDILQEAMEGKVISKKEEFFLRNKQGELEFTLLAEGFRKLGLLWLLIQNGTLLGGSTLFWDEPETNLNPRLMEKVVGILIELHRLGVQVFVSTHDYVLLKEFDLAAKVGDKIRYHSLYREKDTNKIVNNSSDTLDDLDPNAIDATFGSIIDRQLSNDIGGLGK